MRRYETISILKPGLSEEEISNIIERSNGILEADGGKIISIDKWGTKKLAYLIKKQSQGYYIYTDYAANPAAVAEMERIFRIDDSVMKYMTVKLADSITSEEIETIINEAKEDAVQESEEATESEEASN